MHILAFGSLMPGLNKHYVGLQDQILLNVHESETEHWLK